MYSLPKNFYPTPPSLISKMIYKIGKDFILSTKCKTILEPSAGKGDIVNELKSFFNHRFHNVPEFFCIEKDSMLSALLKEQSYNVIHDDFLTFSSPLCFDLIIMNPPFEDGEKHLLKAIELQKRYGGKICCLLNAETIRNPFTNSRKALMQELSLLDNVDIEYSLNSFSSFDTERKTNVEIALITIDIPKYAKSNIFENLKKAQIYDDTSVYDDCTYLADKDVVISLIQQYQLEINAGCQLIKEYKALQPLTLCSVGKESCHNPPVLEMTVKGSKDNLINTFVKAIRRKYWSYFFSAPQIEALFTSNLLNNYRSEINSFSNYEFNISNIRQIQIELNNKMIEYLEKTIIDLFEQFTTKHCWFPECSKNIHYYNGWATNKAYKINKKIIIPLNAYSSIFETFQPRYEVLSKLSDIEKTMNYLDTDIDRIKLDISKVMLNAEESEITKNIRCTYFDVTFYKKGTCHITFTDEKLLKKLNIYGGLKNSWLPYEYGKKKYSNMTDVEKAVIDSFEGEESYNLICANPSEYLLDLSNTNFLALTDTKKTA